MTKNSNMYRITCMLLFLVVLSTSCTRKRSIEITSTSPSGNWQKKELAVKISRASSAIPDIQIDTLHAQQVVTGFGGCFNELGWEALQTLPLQSQDAIMKSLFDTISGCRFNLCRMPVGANDYALDWYSYDETPGDYNMTNFSVSRDEKRLIPYIKLAQSLNPHLKMWASPWCPPSWMKTNNHYACASDKKYNDLPAASQGSEMTTQFRMEDRILKAYALYFQKFIEAYSDHGIHISTIHPQNELNSCQVFPSCIWRPGDMARFIGDYLGPQLERAGLSTSIFMGTVERPQIERLDSILQHPRAKKYIQGVGFQWAGMDAIPLVHKKYPGLMLIQTETECGDGSNDRKAAQHTWELMRHYFSNGANAYMYWNMILDESGKSQWGWKQNSMITVDRKSGQVTYNPEFSLMKHVAAFVMPGARYIPVENQNCLAFMENDHIIAILNNPLSRDHKITVQINGLAFAVTLPASSFNTLVF
jgi:glucosylceramidase